MVVARALIMLRIGAGSDFGLCLPQTGIGRSGHGVTYGSVRPLQVAAMTARFVLLET
jgi:hypothetical protein